MVHTYIQQVPEAIHWFPTRDRDFTRFMHSSIDANDALHEVVTVLADRRSICDYPPVTRQAFRVIRHLVRRLRDKGENEHDVITDIVETLKAA